MFGTPMVGHESSATCSSHAAPSVQVQLLTDGPLASTLFKVGLAVVLGSGPFRRRAGAVSGRSGSRAR